MAGYNLEYYKMDNLSGYRQNFDFPLHELNTGISSVQTNTGKSEEWGIMSAFSVLTMHSNNVICWK